MKELNEAMWEGVVKEAMAAAGKTKAEFLTDRKGADWKVEIALNLRTRTTADNLWIANRLKMRHPS